MVKKPKTNQLKAGQLLEFEDGNIGAIMPIHYSHTDTVCFVEDLDEDWCQQLLTYDVMEEGHPDFGEVVAVWGLPTDLTRVWLKISRKSREIIWKKEKTE